MPLLVSASGPRVGAVMVPPAGTRVCANCGHRWSMYGQAAKGTFTVAFCINCKLSAVAVAASAPV